MRFVRLTGSIPRRFVFFPFFTSKDGRQREKVVGREGDGGGKQKQRQEIADKLKEIKKELKKLKK